MKTYKDNIENIDKTIEKIVIVVGEWAGRDNLEVYSRAGKAWEGSRRNSLGDWEYDEGLLFTDEEVLEVVEFEKAHGNRVYFDDKDGYTVFTQ